MSRKAFFILFTIFSTLTLGACGSSSSGGGGGAPGPQPTNLDPSFGTNGKIVTEFFAGNNAGVYDVVIRSDRKILVAGFADNGSNSDFALARYNEDGSLDATFNNQPGCLAGDICNGKLITDFGGGNDVARNVVIISGGPNNGKIVVSGWASNGTDDDFAMARYNTNGTLDTSFGSAGTGKVTTSYYSNKPDQARAMTLQTDGKIVLAGHSQNGTINDFALARYNTNGTLDASFNNMSPLDCLLSIGICNGLQVTDFTGGHDYVEGIAIQPDGKIVAAGQTEVSTNTDFALARYNTNGTLDTTFGNAGTGKVSTPFYSGQNDGALAITLQSDGKIVVAGSAKASGSGFNDFALARYNVDGTLDTSFNTHLCISGVPCSGQVVTDFDGGFDNARAIAIQPLDDKIVVAGTAFIGSDTDFALVRYNTDGSLDTSFGAAGTGKITTNFGDSDSANALVLLNDGRIMVAGTTLNGTNYTFALARYLP